MAKEQNKGESQEQQEEIQEIEKKSEALPDEIVPKTNEYKNWIKMTHEDMLSSQKNGTLIGYHPAKGLGLVKPEEIKRK